MNLDIREILGAHLGVPAERRYELPSGRVYEHAWALPPCYNSSHGGHAVPTGFQGGAAGVITLGRSTLVAQTVGGILVWSAGTMCWLGRTSPRWHWPPCLQMFESAIASAIARVYRGRRYWRLPTDGEPVPLAPLLLGSAPSLRGLLGTGGISQYPCWLTPEPSTAPTRERRGGEGERR